MNLRVVERDDAFAGEMDMRSLTIEYLKEHCRRELGSANLALLDEPQGLEKVQLKLFYGNIEREASLLVSAPAAKRIASAAAKAA